MAQEAERKCGYRHAGGLYLAGEFFFKSCDRLPLELKVCSVCGQGIKVGRGFTKINPYRLWGTHNSSTIYVANDNSNLPLTVEPCHCIHPCNTCDPKDRTAYIMLVGTKFYATPEEFIEEGKLLGISKRIPFVPKEFKAGETVIYLAHHKAVKILVPADCTKEKLPDADHTEYRTGIFAAFIPQRVEKIIWKSDADKETLQALKERGITPVILEDGDADHV